MRWLRVTPQGQDPPRHWKRHWKPCALMRKMWATLTHRTASWMTYSTSFVRCTVVSSCTSSPPPSLSHPLFLPAFLSSSLYSISISLQVVFVVSGKELYAVSEFFGDVRGLGLGAEHGFYYRWPALRDESSQGVATDPGKTAPSTWICSHLLLRCWHLQENSCVWVDI